MIEPGFALPRKIPLFFLIGFFMFGSFSQNRKNNETGHNADQKIAIQGNLQG
jgi:hypothetical protein